MTDQQDVFPSELWGMRRRSEKGESSLGCRTGTAIEKVRVVRRGVGAGEMGGECQVTGHHYILLTSHQHVTRPTAATQ